MDAVDDAGGWDDDVERAIAQRAARGAFGQPVATIEDERHGVRMSRSTAAAAGGGK